MRIFIALTLLASACGGTAATDVLPPDEPAIAGLHLTPSSGDWWRFTLTETAHGQRTVSSYRFVLGAEQPSGAFELIVEGGPYAEQAWRYLAFDARGLSGSDDGDTFVPLFDAWDGAWASAGGLWRTAREGPVLVEEEVRAGRAYQHVRVEGDVSSEVYVAPWGPFAHGVETCTAQGCVRRSSVLSETSYAR